MRANNSNKGIFISAISSYWKTFRLIFLVFFLYLMGDAFYRWDGFNYYGSFAEFLPSVALISVFWSVFAVIISMLVWLLTNTMERVLPVIHCKIKAKHILLFIFFLVILGSVTWIAKIILFGRGSSTITKFITFSGVSSAALLLTWFFRDKVDLIQTNTMERVLLVIHCKIKAEHILLFIFFLVILGSVTWFAKTNVFGRGSSTIIKFITFSGISSVALLLTWFFRDKVDLIQERITPLVWLFGIIVFLSWPLVLYHSKFSKTQETALEKPVQSSAVKEERSNILLVTFDALRAQNMSLYGYDLPTTPFISKWAENASVFTRAEADSNLTVPTTASLMTGKKGWTHGRWGYAKGSEAFRADIENLPILLKNNGYFNMVFNSNPTASVHTMGVSSSFNIIFSPTKFMDRSDLQDRVDFFLQSHFGAKVKLYDWITQDDFIFRIIMKKISGDRFTTQFPVRKVFYEFFKLIDQQRPEPFFAWIHLLPPHDPYLPPAPYIGMFDSSPEFRSRNSQDRFLSEPPDHMKGEVKRWRIFHEFPNELKPQVDILRKRYDEFIRYCDDEFEFFINQLIKRDLLNNTLVILSSDHGESFEHNYLLHGSTLYETETHIPLIIKEPGQADGRIINETAEQVDIPATILEIAGLPTPSWMEGRSLMPLINGMSLNARTSISMSLFKNRSGQPISTGTLAVWEGDYKLIHSLDDGTSKLFNLEDDPDELIDLFDDRPEISERLLSRIQNGLRSANERIRVEVEKTLKSMSRSGGIGRRKGRKMNTHAGIQ